MIADLTGWALLAVLLMSPVWFARWASKGSGR
jgi:hypothetical protein